MILALVSPKLRRNLKKKIHANMNKTYTMSELPCQFNNDRLGDNKNVACLITEFKSTRMFYY